MRPIEVIISIILALGSIAFVIGIYQALNDSNRKKTRRIQH